MTMRNIVLAVAIAFSLIANQATPADAGGFLADTFIRPIDRGAEGVPHPRIMDMREPYTCCFGCTRKETALERYERLFKTPVIIVN